MNTRSASRFISAQLPPALRLLGALAIRPLAALLFSVLPAVAAPTAPLTEAQVEARITGCAEFSLTPPRSDGPVALAADFGLREDAEPEANVLALQKALAWCKTHRASRLTLAPGTYRLRWFNPKPVDEPLAYVSALSATPAVTRLIALEGLQDFVLDGQGAQFLVLDTEQYSLGAMLYIANCQRVEVKNLTFDWDWAARPLAALGTITAVNRQEKFIDWHIPGVSLPPDTKLNLETGTNSKPWDLTTNMRPPEIKPFHLEPNSPGFAGLGLGDVQREEVLDAHRLRVWFNKPGGLALARVGQGANLTFHTQFDPYGVEANSNDHLALRDLTFHAALNHRAFSADDNAYLEISRCRIVPPAGTTRAKTAHGTFEIHNSRGHFLFQDNVVDTEMDDFMHLSDGFIGGGIRVEGPRTLRCERIQYYSARYTLRPGAVITFHDTAFAPLGHTRTIETVQWLADAYPAKDKQHAALVTFTEALPDGLKRETILRNQALGTGHYILRRNRGTTLACRGIYTCWPNGLIEDNVLENAGYGGIWLGLSPFGSRWFNGPGPSNVIIRGNQFNQVNRVRRDKADIDLMSPPGTTRYFSGILIENNTVAGSVSSAVINLSNVDGLIVRHNRFIGAKAAPADQVKIKDSDHVFVHDNTQPR